MQTEGQFNTQLTDLALPDILLRAYSAIASTEAGRDLVREGEARPRKNRKLLEVSRNATSSPVWATFC